MEEVVPPKFNEEESSLIVQYTLCVLRYSPFSEWKKVVDTISSLVAPPIYLRLLVADYYASCADIPAAIDILTECEKESPQNGLLLAMIQWLLHQNYKLAYEIYMKVLEANPEDLFVCKRAQLMALIGGFNDSIVTPAKVAKVDPSSATAFYLPGMMAFGYEQLGDYDESKWTARETQFQHENEETDPWMVHAVAHMYYFKGMHAEGLKWLKPKIHLWSLDKMMPFLYTHLWWHYALVNMELGNASEAMQVLDDKIWNSDSELQCDSQVQINAMGLLLRVQSSNRIAGLDTRWQSVACAANNYYAEAEGTPPADNLHFTLTAISLHYGNPDLLHTHLERMDESEEVMLVVRKVLEVLQGSEKAKLDLKDMEENNLWCLVGGSTEQRAVLFGAVLEMHS